MIYYRQGELHDGGVRQSITSPAFRFGVGLFETLLYNGTAICHLQAHLTRARQSLDYFGFQADELDYENAIREVLAANDLLGGHARVNIFFPVEDDDGTVAPVVTAALHTPQPTKTYRLTIASSPVQHPYFVHKSMNYMFHWMERRTATLQGYDDAVLTQPGGILLETTSAALIFSDGTNFCAPNSHDRLESTALAAAKELLSVHGCTVRMHTATTFRHAYVLNSLIGMRPVSNINGTRYEPDEDTCRRMTAVICG
ncbi:aminotransferase class IV [Desulfovibrio mangrovi]|uniref:aminotransferase class IV n=1 Tax=Desulfovibrio mangrovi TaxID=2976983 RepID=UPI0022459C49|nr:aminotransferase class IV [Desulfovibrio mangrovi]UZP66442.1 aminotransferase class IV [Desulfovibrio mangrovi]